MKSRRFAAPWRVEQVPGGFKVLDANGQALAASKADSNGSSEVVRFGSESAVRAM